MPGKGGEIKKAHRAMCSLIGLSSPCNTALAPIELHAKAAVLAVMYGLRNDEEPNETELAYISFFARRGSGLSGGGSSGGRMKRRRRSIRNARRLRR
jgi:hypothetical protein